MAVHLVAMPGALVFWGDRPVAPKDQRIRHRQRRTVNCTTSLRDDPVQHRAAIDAPKLSTQLLSHLSPERIFGPLARLDVTTWEVPHTSGTTAGLANGDTATTAPPQDHGYNVVAIHRRSIPLRGKGCQRRD
jgi:hypothetical protein